MTTTPRIVVLGAGYAGLTAAKLLAKRTGGTVTLINNRDRFVERMRNHQLAAGQKLRDLPLHDLLEGTGTRLVIDQVTRIDTDGRRVELAGGAEPVDYDLLVYALGSHADLHSVPGAAEHAHAVAVAEQATRLHERMRTTNTVAVVGAGLTGLEAVTELAETHPDKTVRLVTGGALGAALSERGAEYLHRTCDRLGIQVWEHAHVAKVDADGLLLEGGEHIDADTVAWTAGFKVPELAREAGLATDDRGRMVVDGSMRSVSHPEVYGIGDAAAARNQDGQVLRMGCGPAGLITAVGVRAITDRLAGRTPTPKLRFKDTLCIGLGQRDALLQFLNPDNSPREKVLRGRPAAMLKKGVWRGTVYNLRYPAMTMVGTIGRV